MKLIDHPWIINGFVPFFFIFFLWSSDAVTNLWLYILSVTEIKDIAPHKVWWNCRRDLFFFCFVAAKTYSWCFVQLNWKKKTWDFEGCRGCEKFVLLSQQATAEKWKFGNRKKIFIILLCVRYASVCSCFVYTPETVAIHFQLAIFRRQIDTNNRIRHFFVIKICLLVWLNGEWFLFINREEMGIRYTAKKYVCVFCSTHLDV